MNSTPPHLGTLEEIKETGIPGLVEVLREESLDAVRYVLWDVPDGTGTIGVDPRGFEPLTSAVQRRRSSKDSS